MANTEISEELRSRLIENGEVAFILSVTDGGTTFTASVALPSENVRPCTGMKSIDLAERYLVPLLDKLLAQAKGKSE